MSATLKEFCSDNHRSAIRILPTRAVRYLKELSHEIEMGCCWYGWIEPYLEMNP
jgi:hypothetical protein